MSNGAVLQGFISGFIDEEFLELIEIDNTPVYVRVDDISFVRMGENKSISQPEQECFSGDDEGSISIPRQLSHEFIKPAVVKGDYSMKMPRPAEEFEAENYKMPEFIRKTRRDENISEED